MRTRRRKVRSTIPSRRQDSIPRKQSMESTILHVQRRYSNTSPINHQQIQSEPLNEELAIMLQALAIQRMKHSMPRPVRSASRSMSLTAFPAINRLSTYWPLIYSPVLRPTKRHTPMLELRDCGNSFSRQIVDRILIS